MIIAVRDAGIKVAVVRLRYNVITRILSASGSRKLPNIDAWPGTFLAIMPSNCVLEKAQLTTYVRVKKSAK